MPALISVVVATYNVARYLPEFLTSLDSQSGGLDGIETIFCDDGSTDGSGQLVAAWLTRNPDRGRLITKSNGGASSARNAGLAVATGTWVTFCDPDDVLTPDYLQIMRTFLGSKKAAGVQLVAGNLVFLDDATGQTSDTHPLRFKFAQHHRIVDLDRHPDFVHLSGATALFRRDVLNEHDLRFDERVFPCWEDAHLTGRYLARFDRPRIALLDDAVYLYRQRADGSSQVQAGWSKAGRYLNVPRHGWLDLLSSIAAERGRVPLWAQNLVLYDLFFYFRVELRVPSPSAGIPEEWRAGFLAALAEVSEYLDVDAIEGFKVTKVRADIRRAVLFGVKGVDPGAAGAYLDRLDKDKRLVRLRYFYTGAPPVEEYRARGFAVRPVFAKVRALRFYGRDLVYERTAWLPATGTLALALDGRAVPLQVASPAMRRYSVGPTGIWAGLAGGPPPVETAVEPPSRVARLRATVLERKAELADPVRAKALAEEVLTRQLARSPYGRRRYGGAWLLTDGADGAGDNAEHLYRYLRSEQPEVNAWFVLDRSAPDWERLAKDGFRLLAQGSREHIVAWANCAHLVSSVADPDLPAALDPPLRVSGDPRFTFLQHLRSAGDPPLQRHGIPIDLMITADPAQHARLVEDGGPYSLSDKEVTCTGFPRHDGLRSRARAVAAADSKVVLVLRNGKKESASDAWGRLVESDRLRVAATEHGWRIHFAASAQDGQEMIAGARVLVTDDSALAEEMAYLERPVVYFGADAPRHPFGPVTDDPESAIDAVISAIVADRSVDPCYSARMTEAFPFRDGECSRRVYEAIVDSTRPLTYEQLYLRVEPGRSGGSVRR